MNAIGPSGPHQINPEVRLESPATLAAICAPGASAVHSMGPEISSTAVDFPARNLVALQA